MIVKNTNDPDFYIPMKVWKSGFSLFFSDFLLLKAFSCRYN